MNSLKLMGIVQTIEGRKGIYGYDMDRVGEETGMRNETTSMVVPNNLSKDELIACLEAEIHSLKGDFRKEGSSSQKVQQQETRVGARQAIEKQAVSNKIISNDITILTFVYALTLFLSSV